MRAAAIYDIHSNLPALEAVIHEIRTESVDLIVVGGDVVPGPMPRETIDFLNSIDLPMAFIHGNGDRALLDVMQGREPTSLPPQAHPLIRWVAGQLGPDDAEMIAEWPSTLTLDFDDFGRVLFCHATPESDTPIFSKLTPVKKLLPLFSDLEVDVVMCGHTHMQFDRRIGDVRVVNAGSVGMPFGEAGAYWAMIETDIELRRTRYDLEAAAARIRASSYPQADFAESYVLSRPSEKEILEKYSKAELR